MTGDSSQSSNTISLKFGFKNNGDQDIDLSNVKVRYYFTKDGNANQVFFCDHSGMSLDSSPWYVSVTGDVKGRFVDMPSGIEGADSYFELSLEDVTYDLPAGKQLDCQMRITNSDWSNFNLENDYSHQNIDHVVLMINDKIVSGIEPN